MPNYTVTLEVRETRYLTYELPEVEAKTRQRAILAATKIYMDTGSRQFLLCCEDTEENKVAFATAEEDE